MNLEDVRVQRTRRLLREALMQEVAAQGFEAISVKDITDRAGVGYKTFYRHYRDKEDLLYSLLGEILAEAQGVLLPPSSPLTAEQNTINAVRFAGKYADLFRVLLRSPAAERLVQPLIAFGLSEGALFFGGSDTPTELITHHFAMSMMFLIRWWLEHDMLYRPEEMAEYINRLVIRPISSLAQK